MERELESAPRSPREVFLLDRSPGAVTLHLLRTSLSLAHGEPHAGRLHGLYCAASIDDAAALLQGIAVTHAGEAAGLACPPEVAAAIRRAARACPATRLVLPGPGHSTVIRLGVASARDLAAVIQRAGSISGLLRACSHSQSS
ncbi:MAG TPA: hypothetical protein VNN10_15805 [Dehalococcoidia bacterium]|nr:hypothetical protein [Dehalococcoidia bacterium]